jgi:hypothetical protein
MKNHGGGLNFTELQLLLLCLMHPSQPYKIDLALFKIMYAYSLTPVLKCQKGPLISHFALKMETIRVFILSAITQKRDVTVIGIWFLLCLKYVFY